MKRFNKVKSMNIEDLSKFFFDEWINFYAEKIICAKDCPHNIIDPCYGCIEEWLSEELE